MRKILLILVVCLCLCREGQDDKRTGSIFRSFAGTTGRGV